MRCFIALGLPDGCRARLAEAAGRLAPLFPGARWVRPESFHVTLAFLGDLEAEALECAGEAVRSAAVSGALELGFSGVSFLPGRGPARVLALEAGPGARQCAAIHERVNRALAEAASMRGLSPLNPEWPDGRPFRAHMTLARAGARPLPRLSREAWAEIGANLQAPCRVTRCILYRSDLFPDGARYEPLVSVELRQGIERSRDASG